MSYLFGQPSVLTNTESTNGTFYVLFEDSTTGVMAPRSDSGLTYNPSTNTLTSGIVVSTVSTGTAPLTVASTTLVTNLNADKIDGLDVPAITGNGGKVLTVNVGATALEWTTASGQGADYTPFNIAYNGGTGKLEFTYTA